MAQELPTLIQARRDTAANWAALDPILAEAEFGYETDTKILRMGDGVTVFTMLDGFQPGAGSIIEINNATVTNPDFTDSSDIAFSVAGSIVTAFIVDEVEIEFNGTSDWTTLSGISTIDFVHNLNSDKIVWEIYNTENTEIAVQLSKVSNARLRITLNENERFSGRIYIEKVG